MKLGRINDWLQVVGTFGVVASLVFVGLQLKQTQDIALASAYNDRAGQTIDMRAGITGSPQYLSALAKIYSGHRDRLTAEEYVVLDELFIMMLTVFENNHFQYTRGFLPESHFQKNLEDIECAMSEPVFREFAGYWEARDTFRVLLDKAIERGRQVAQSCWVSSRADPWPYFNPVE